MSLELPTVTALGVVSTGCVASSSEIFNVPPVVPVVVVAAPTSPVVVAAVVVVVRKGVGCGDGAAPGAPASAAGAAAPGSVNACTSTGNTSPAEMYRRDRLTGCPNSTLASNSRTSLRMKGMLIGRVTT